MKDDMNPSELDDTDISEVTGNSITDTNYTQVASCAVGDDYKERRRQSLRAKLEREQYERGNTLQQSFITTFCNLFSITRH